MPRSTRDTARTLLSKALEQGGYFTAKQAKETGYDYPHLDYHVSTGNFERVEHGLYRLTSLPVGENDDLVRLSLWSRNRQDVPQAVLSHESALVLHELAELLPDKVHLTVPPGFRKRAPAGCVLHKAALGPREVEERIGFRVTSPARTLLDVAASGVSREQLEKAAVEALTRGLVQRSKLAALAARDHRFARLVRILEARVQLPHDVARQGCMAKRFGSAAAFKNSLEAHLRKRSLTLSVTMSTLQLKFVIERLLARLFHQPRPPWLLKGGFAMDLRFRPQARTTKDVDLSMTIVEAITSNELSETLRDRLQTAVDVDLGDYLSFRIGEPKQEFTNAPAGGARYPCEAVLVGKTYARLHIDVGYGDVLIGEPEQLVGDDILSYAGIAPATVLAIPKAQQFAEKLHAYTFPWYGRINTRTKDLVDLLLLIERGVPNPDEFREAILATFSTRKTHPLPVSLGAPPEEWASEFIGMATEAGLSTTDYLAAFAKLKTFWNGCGLGGERE
jgi:predicted transcriptional regulator of viral defense system